MSSSSPRGSVSGSKPYKTASEKTVYKLKKKNSTDNFPTDSAGSHSEMSSGTEMASFDKEASSQPNSPGAPTSTSSPAVSNGPRKSTASELDAAFAKDIENILSSFQRTNTEGNVKTYPFLARVYIYTREPLASVPAFLYAVISLLVIALSCVTYVIQTLPSYDNDNAQNKFYKIQIILVSIFSFDIMLRIFTSVSFVKAEAREIFTAITAHSGTAGLTYTADNHPQLNFVNILWRFMVRFMTIIDLLILVPFYVSIGVREMGFSEHYAIGVVHVLRLLPLARLANYTNGFELFGSVLYRSRQALLLLFYYVIILTLVSASLVYYAERGALLPDPNDATSLIRQRRNLLDTDYEMSPFKSIPHSWYWAFVTVTTVGYGDMYPTSPVGRALANATMILGVLTLALPITIIGSQFSVVYEEHNKKTEEKEKRMRELFAKTLPINLIPGKLFGSSSSDGDETEAKVEVEVDNGNKTATTEPVNALSNAEREELVRLRALFKKLQFDLGNVAVAEE